jgi:hypothetical protein
MLGERDAAAAATNERGGTLPTDVRHV